MLYSGQPIDMVAEAILFPNFQFPTKSWNSLFDHKAHPTDWDWPALKGGFLLPRKIRDAKIILGERDEEVTFNSLGQKKRLPQPVGKRIVTGPEIGPSSTS